MSNRQPPPGPWPAPAWGAQPAPHPQAAAPAQQAWPSAQAWNATQAAWPQYGGPQGQPAGALGQPGAGWAPPPQSPPAGWGAPYPAPTPPPFNSASAGAAALPSRGAYGDKAGEHLTMKRGRFGAWIYVVFAFIGQMAVLGMLAALPVGILLAMVTNQDEVIGGCAFAAGLLVGVPAAYFVYRDRWRCIEAFSSRFCSGMVNISVLYVPAIAFVYANVRGFRKLAGR